MEGRQSAVPADIPEPPARGETKDPVAHQPGPGNMAEHRYNPKSLSESEGELNEREHFIPIRAAQLLRCILRQRCMSRADIESFQTVADLIGGLYNQAYFHRLEDLIEDYSSFDPDKELVFHHREGKTLRGLRGQRFVQQLGEILRRGNYVRLSEEHLERVLNLSAGWGVRYTVDFEQLDLLEIYVRGIQKTELKRRLWFRFWKTDKREVDCFSRVVLIFRARQGHAFGDKLDANSIYMKVFKDIPETEVDMMIPGSRAKFSWTDQGKIFLPALGGIFSGIKLAKNLVIWGPRLMWVVRFMALTSIIKWIGGSNWFTRLALNENGDGLNLVGWMIAATLAITFYAVKSILSYSRTSRDHQNHLTNNLYYRNLGNNSGVLFRLLEDAKEQELREVLLAYYLLWHKAGERGFTSDELDAEAEAFLKRLVQRDVDFEIGDALRKLVGWSLAQRNEAGRWIARSPDFARKLLREYINRGVHVNVVPATRGDW